MSPAGYPYLIVSVTSEAIWITQVNFLSHQMKKIIFHLSMFHVWHFSAKINWAVLWCRKRRRLWRRLRFLKPFFRRWRLIVLELHSTFIGALIWCLAVEPVESSSSTPTQLSWTYHLKSSFRIPQGFKEFCNISFTTSSLTSVDMLRGPAFAALQFCHLQTLLTF